MSYIEVTDKHFKMDKFLVDMLNSCIHRIKHKWDVAICVDGVEGSGKSNLAIGCGYYLAHKLGKKFTHHNTFFDLEALINFASTARQEVIVFDEAALGAMGADFQNQMQRKLIKMLITSRKHGNVFIFVIPQFFRLNRYIAYDRTIALLHTYSRDGISRGDFLCLGMKKKNKAYDLSKRGMGIKSYKPYDFAGSFPKGYEGLIDTAEYDKKKDKAIMDICKEDVKKDNPYMIKLKALQYKVANIRLIKQKDMALCLDITPRTLQKWAKLRGETENANSCINLPKGEGAE